MLYWQISKFAASAILPMCQNEWFVIRIWLIGSKLRFYRAFLYIYNIISINIGGFGFVIWDHQNKYEKRYLLHSTSTEVESVRVVFISFLKYR